MFKPLSILLAALVLFAGSASADTRRFVYRGFDVGNDRLFSQYASRSGSFTGEDSNGNGLLEANELTQFMLGYYDLVACDRPTFTCSIEEFSFSRTGGLYFNVHLSSQGSKDLFTIDWQSDGLYLDRNVTTGLEFRRYYVTPRTFVGVTGVPEPAGAAMLGLGSGVLLLSRRHLGKGHRKDPLSQMPRRGCATSS